MTDEEWLAALDDTIPAPFGGPKPGVPIPDGLADTPGRDEPLAPLTIDAPAPAFAAHFTDPLYYDASDEFGPFGTDEGWDLLFAAAAEGVAADATVRDVVEQFGIPESLIDPASNGPDLDGFLIGGGFALLYLTGRIDAEGRELTLGALHRQYSWYAEQQPRQLAVMARDLAAFPDAA